MKILVIDGQGGRIGSLLIEKIKESKIPCNIIAVGTNVMATSAMLKAGADAGATGENPIVVNSRDADYIAGPVGSAMADSLLGEITPAMAAAVSGSNAFKLLIPMNRCNHYIAGIRQASLADLIQDAVNKLLETPTE